MDANKALRQRVIPLAPDIGGSIQVEDAAHHRNGVCGESFWAVRFIWWSSDATQAPRRMLATLFVDHDEEERIVPQTHPRIAVYDLAQLPDIRFGVNSWRGDLFDHALCAILNEWEIQVNLDPVPPGDPRDPETWRQKHLSLEATKREER